MGNELEPDEVLSQKNLEDFKAKEKKEAKPEAKAGKAAKES